MLISREEWLKNQKEREARRANADSTPRSNVGFMSLADGDEAIVRFAPLDWDEILYFHQESDDWKSRRIACTRNDFNDPLDKCPFCAAKKPLRNRYFVKMIHYTRDEEGNVVATNKVWDAPSRYISILTSKEDDYGPIENMIFKMKRMGSGQSTTYDFSPMISPVYNESVYKKDFGDLQKFKALGTIVKELSAEEMKNILNGTVEVKEPAPAPRKVSY